jgi:hypothetical protein
MPATSTTHICLVLDRSGSMQAVREDALGGVNSYIHAAKELQYVFRHLGHDMQLVADLSRNSPTLATWERERADWEFEQAWLLIVTGHWVAVRGRWFVDTWTGGVPVRIADAPRRRKRVRFAYRITVAPS